MRTSQKILGLLYDRLDNSMADDNSTTYFLENLNEYIIESKNIGHDLWDLQDWLKDVIENLTETKEKLKRLETSYWNEVYNDKENAEENLLKYLEEN